uniref:Uncharacterized protein n=1 Tax=Anthurium amnicola TaxID=1678845 RepID=A0A1D1Y9Z7_9ARAE
MASPDVRGVLDFLRQNGFERAASALREDVLAMGAASGMDSSVCSAPAPCVEEAHIPLRLPPVRVGVPPDVDGYAVGGGRSGAQSSTSSSSSTDAFLSMGSSPSGLANPYAPWPVYPAESEDSSDRLSQFGTARDYDGPNIFSDTFWEDPYLLMGSSAGFTDEDKFVMSIEAEERFTVSKDTRFASETSPKTRSNYCAEMCACSVCSGMKEYCGGESTEHVDVFLSSSLRKTQPAVSSCAESFSTSGERGFELKFVDNPGGVSLEGDLSRYALCGSEQCEGMQISEPQILEKELDLLSSFTFPRVQAPIPKKILH